MAKYDALRLALLEKLAKLSPEAAETQAQALLKALSADSKDLNNGKETQ